jgi:hypothetical protein
MLRTAAFPVPVRLRGQGDLLYAGETVHNNGPWTVRNDYLKFNGVLCYSVDDAGHGWSITGMASKADWNSTDQIQLGTLQTGLIKRFDALSIRPIAAAVSAIA